MVPVLAAILLAGALGAAPALVTDACGSDTVTPGDNTCAVDKIDRRMKSLEVPSELKVEAEGKLYSVPEDVTYCTPAPQGSAESWWKELARNIKRWIDKKPAQTKTLDTVRPAEGEAASESPDCPVSDAGGGNGTATAAPNKDARSTGEHSCQICFEHEHSTVMLPCGHGGLCWDCGLQIYALTEECPMCRDKIKLLVQVDGEKRRYEGEDEFISAVCAS